MDMDISQIMEPMQPRERRAVGVIALIAVFRMVGLFALLPVLGIYARDLESATPLLIGIAIGGYGLTQAALQIPYGALSDRIGRVPVIIAGLLLFAAGSLLAGFSDDIQGVIAGRLLQGAGAISATLSALLSDATRESVRTRSMAIFGVGIGVSFMVALILGPVIAAAAGVRSLFWMAAALAIAAIGLVAILPRDIRPPAVSPRINLSAAFRPALIRLDLYIFVLHAIMTATFVALQFLLRDSLDLLLERHWLIYVGALVVSLLGTVPLIIVDDRRGKTATISTAILMLLIGLLGLALVGTTVTMVLIALAVFFAGFNFLEAGLPARLSILATEEVRGASLGVFSSAQFLGAFAGGVMGGYLLSGGNTALIFMACAVIAAVWLILHRIGR